MTDVYKGNVNAVAVQFSVILHRPVQKKAVALLQQPSH